MYVCLSLCGSWIKTLSLENPKHQTYEMLLLQELLDQISRKEEQFIISEHFSRPDHEREDLKVQILEAGNSKLSWDRKAAKQRWMKKLTAEDIGSD